MSSFRLNSLAELRAVTALAKATTGIDVSPAQARSWTRQGIDGLVLPAMEIWGQPHTSQFYWDSFVAELRMPRLKAAAESQNVATFTF